MDALRSDRGRVRPAADRRASRSRRGPPVTPAAGPPAIAARSAFPSGDRC
jgi:hypothetical protein